MLSNLVGNALTHGSSTKPVIVHAESGESVLELWVSNGGPPIPQAAMDKLFEPFFRGNAHASRQGLGLGLYIASQIAKAHGGELTVSSTSEETKFTFTMPLSAEAQLLLSGKVARISRTATPHSL
jgi:sigma-B regulation protein RsbU (phosphoserine phosphatase)